MNALALADDATGALETGARLCEAGLEAVVRFEPDLAGSATSLVIDTETRHLPAEQAAERIRDIATRARQARVVRIFKKTDSTLRGPIAAEFRALLDVWPELPLVYAPAYPALGRTVRNGELLVDGRPLSQTAFARDPLNPSREGSIAALLGADSRIRICDGETDADLAAVAESVRDIPCIVAGTAAMASAWARSISNEKPLRRKPDRAVRTCLVVNGSLHPASREQLAHSGIPALTHTPAADPLDLGNLLARLVTRNRWAALCASPARAGKPLAVAAHAARVTAHAIRQSAPECLIVFGGDTVFAILHELGIREATPHGELVPGVPASTVAGPMLLVTKAGGFGAADYLLRVRRLLE